MTLAETDECCRHHDTGETVTSSAIKLLRQHQRQGAQKASISVEVVKEGGQDEDALPWWNAEITGQD